MPKIIDFDDAVKTLRKKGAKQFSKAADASMEAFGEFYKSSFKSADDIAEKVSRNAKNIANKEIIEESAKRSAQKIMDERKLNDELNRLRPNSQASVNGSVYRQMREERILENKLSGEIEKLTPNGQASVNREAYARMREKRITENRAKELKSTLREASSESKARNSVFSTMDDEAFNKQQKRVDKQIQRRRNQGYYTSDPTENVRRVTPLSPEAARRQEVLKSRLSSKHSEEDLNNFRQRKNRQNNIEENAVSGSSNSIANKLVGYGVGGGLVFSMFNNKGQQSNEQLYGQR